MPEHTNFLRYLYQLITLYLVLMLGCTEIKPAGSPYGQFVEPGIFSHTRFDRVLQRFVDDDGRVDYRKLKQDPRDLDRYYHLIATYSPDNHPELFPSENHKLAYWINAYNATAIKTVLTYYPLSSVLDIKPPAVFFFLTDKSGFFVFQRLTYGGKTTSLYYLESSVIRERFQEPRIHFALNCAALGCPRLPQEAFTGEDLQRQLYEETLKFLSEERNFKIDHEEKTIYLSSIFKWYEKDFLDEIQDRFPDRKGTLLDYVTLYLPAEKAYELNKAGDRYKIDFVPYDWGLNDQK
jgi:hypothetical protein